MNQLAEIIIAKLEVKQQQWDDEFHNSVQDLYGKESSKEAFIMTEEEALIGEEDASPAFPTLQDLVTVEVRPSATTDVQVEVFAALV